MVWWQHVHRHVIRLPWVLWSKDIWGEAAHGISSTCDQPTIPSLYASILILSTHPPACSTKDLTRLGIHNAKHKKADSQSHTEVITKMGFRKHIPTYVLSLERFFHIKTQHLQNVLNFTWEACLTTAKMLFRVVMIGKARPGESGRR